MAFLKIIALPPATTVNPKGMCSIHLQGYCNDAEGLLFDVVIDPFGDKKRQSIIEGVSLLEDDIKHLISFLTETLKQKENDKLCQQ